MGFLSPSLHIPEYCLQTGNHHFIRNLFMDIERDHPPLLWTLTFLDMTPWLPYLNTRLENHKSHPSVIRRCITLYLIKRL